MLAILFAAASAVVPPPAAPPGAPSAKEPTKFCREMNNASSRLYSVKVCRTRAQWRRWEACHASVTRYCTPADRKLAASTLGRRTAFPLNEDSRIICRWLSVTGTRIKQVETCLPKREWDRMWAENSEGLLKRQGEHSTLPRGVR